MDASPILFAGTANPALGEAVARALDSTPGACEIERFPDGELTVRLQDDVRGRDVFIFQPTSPPVNDHLIELLGFVDACRRASAERITAVIPYFGYARGDRRSSPGEPIMASLVAELIQHAGVQHVLLVDVHTPQIEGFFRVPVDQLSAVPLLCGSICEHLPEATIVVSPDAGRVRMAAEYARRLHAPLAVLHKRRESATETKVTNLVGDVRGRPCLVIDDMIATGGTIIESVRALREAGAQPQFYVAATHGLLLGKACTNFAQEGVSEIFVTDSVVPRFPCDTPLHITSIAPLIADTIRCTLEAAGSVMR